MEHRRDRGRAEMHRDGVAMIAAIRYHDMYRRYLGNWRFSERILSFFYYVPAAEYVEALEAGLATRMRAYRDKSAPDWPERLPTWKKFYGI